MAVVNRIQLSEAVANNRFSAEFFDPRYVFKPTNPTDWVPIGRVLKKCEYGLSISMNSDGRGFPIFRMNEIDNCFALRPIKYANIPRWLFNIYALKENDILFNRTNSFEFVGRTGIVKNQTDCTFASYLIRLVPDQDKLLPEFLTIYLNTIFGIGQIKRRAMRSINQANVSGSEVRKILIPLFDFKIQQDIAGLVNTAFLYRTKSDAKYAEAQQLLESELGLDKLSFQKTVGYTALLSELEQSRRSDADFFNPELRYLYQELRARLDLKAMTQFAKILKFSNPHYGTNGLPIVTQKHLRSLTPAGYQGDLIATNSWVRSNTEAILKINDLLYYSVGAYLGKTNLWLAEDEAVPASFITILRCHEKTDAGFLQVLLNSRYGILQSKSFQSGTSQQYIYPKDIRNFLIPDISKSSKEEILNLVVESYKNLKESRRLLEEAKTRVEQLIEEAVKS